MRRFFEYLPVLLVSVLAAYPIVVGVPDFVDSANHFYRLVALDWHVQHFDFYPRWFDEMHYGFGAPVFNFYAPLSYYFALLFRIFGLSLPLCYALGYGLAVGVGTVGVYVWAREIGYSELASFAGSAAMCSAPYLYMNTTHRGAYPETWGLALAPWVFWAALIMVRTKNRAAPFIFTVIFAALILTHNLVAFIIAPLLSFYIWALLFFDPTATLFQKISSFIHHFSFVILSIALAAFYIIPVALESKYVFLTRTIVADFFYSFSSFSELLAWPIHFDPLRLNNPVGRTYSIPALALSVIGGGLMLLSLLRLRTSHSTQKAKLRESFFFTLHFLLFVILTYGSLPFSEIFWVSFPLVRFIQLPWRLLGPAAIFLALLTSATVEMLLPKIRQPFIRYFLFFTFLLSLWLFVLPWTFHQPFNLFPANPSPATVIKHELNAGLIGTTSNGEFVPQWVYEFPVVDLMLPRYEKESMPSHIAALPEGVKCQTVNLTLKSEEVKCEATKEFTLSFYRFYFPGWVATIDNQEVPLNIAAPNGNMAIAVAAGSHTIKVALQPTAPQAAGTSISLVGLIVLLGNSYFKILKR